MLQNLYRKHDEAKAGNFIFAFRTLNSQERGKKRKNSGRLTCWDI